MAIAVFEDFQLTPEVVDFKSTDLPQPIFEMLVLEIFTLLPDFMVTLQLAETLPEVAVIFADPADFAVTTPFESTVATEVLELVQLTELAPLAVIASLLPV